MMHHNQQIAEYGACHCPCHRGGACSCLLTAKWRALLSRPAPEDQAAWLQSGFARQAVCLNNAHHVVTCLGERLSRTEE